MATLLPHAIAPLFERLCADADAPVDSAALDERGLRASIGRELARLLNSRSRLDFETFERRELTVLDYGLPDFSALSTRSGEDLERLRRAVQRAIARYEPRLQHPRIRIEPAAGTARARIRIEAAISLGLTLRPVQFEIAADPHVLPAEEVS